ncbi:MULTISPECIES: 4-hydroxy-tetrahydrodipicolinate reductase [unclassified Salinibacterium]|uniref:4-hydroxy-tetrahydrodipicolinate reductase n=1 Tax=unclassified Salinibacterium TaxID=2632331 RepID=UPI0018CC80DF|nr:MULTISPECIES: 4-hydroxy-tetrahydrodipicolinate reductase [unclassified Salinibacterium]MBH0025309.1 4-hydroxy-tetrahydrodipicolinate reductase [Salinibacterium sp. SWN248]MBH0055282.1 4-hydroxy-tetrahydrodipicolinate reductase [Salinibacterium sp. SWN139]MBH0084423.1 4-hydroxy-tetrahydrodipicolinate reductase [Salinibacterium sp. SWN167]MBH0117913.1 4-hydroxy-tetrahydrodipicolinate reductase [Salinibacterium sp. NG253]
MTTKVAVVGATGRMGKYISGVVEAAADFSLVAALNSRSELSEMLAADIVVDVTEPSVSPSVVDFAISNGKSVLVGTSGWSEDRVQGLRSTLTETPEVGVVIIPNFSVGSALATSFATAAARYFDSIEIIESHHAAKVDSPSGTAVRTAELMADARSERGPALAPHVDQRARGEQVAGIPVHSLRMTGVIAHQQVIFGGPGEVLTIDHRTMSQDSYEAGILLGLRAVVSATGVTVGLDQLIDLSPASGAPSA